MTRYLSLAAAMMVLVGCAKKSEPVPADRCPSEFHSRFLAGTTCQLYKKDTANVYKSFTLKPSSVWIQGARPRKWTEKEIREYKVFLATYTAALKKDSR